MQTNTSLKPVLTLLLFLNGLLYQNPTNAQNYSLVWSDEFDNTVINAANWTFETGTGSNGWGNNELQYYTNRPLNAVVQNGELQIIARKENFGGKAYTSARLKTQNKKSWKYGKVEARMKLPSGQGLWPAFWMLGQNIGQVGWPQCGEIDIMEHINTETQVHGTIHWNNNGHQYYSGTKPVNGQQYHTYSIEWTSTAIRWFLDGTVYWEANIANSINSTEEFHTSFFALLNIAVGGDWPGSPNAGTVFPDTMHVDYVRVYQPVVTANEVAQVAREVGVIPNPTHDRWVVQCTNDQLDKPWLVVDSMGHTVRTGRFSQEQTEIETAGLPTGFYLLRIADEKKHLVRLMKE